MPTRLLQAVLVSVSSVLPTFILGVAAPDARSQFGLSEVELGAVLLTFSGCSALLATVTGRLADRWGVRAGLASAFLTSACLLAVSSANHFVGLLMAYAVGGIGQSLGAATANVILSTKAAPVRALDFGLKQSSIPLASLAVGLAIPNILTALGWAAAFRLGIAVPIACVLAIVLGGRRLADRIAPASAGSLPVTDIPASERLGPGVPERLDLRRAAVAGFLGTASMSAMSAFFVLTAVEAGQTQRAAGIALGFAGGVGILGRIGVGWFRDWRGTEPWPIIRGLLACAAVGQALLATIHPPFLTAGIVLGFGLGWAWPGLFFYGAVRARPEAPGAATGLVRIGTALGMALGPLGFGLLVSALGYRSAWAGFALLAAGAAATMPSQRRPVAAVA